MTGGRSTRALCAVLVTAGAGGCGEAGTPAETWTAPLRAPSPHCMAPAYVRNAHFRLACITTPMCLVSIKGAVRRDRNNLPVPLAVTTAGTLCRGGDAALTGPFTLALACLCLIALLPGGVGHAGNLSRALTNLRSGRRALGLRICRCRAASSRPRLRAAIRSGAAGKTTPSAPPCKGQTTVTHPLTHALPIVLSSVNLLWRPCDDVILQPTIWINVRKLWRVQERCRGRGAVSCRGTTCSWSCCASAWNRALGLSWRAHAGRPRAHGSLHHWTPICWLGTGRSCRAHCRAAALAAGWSVCSGAISSGRRSSSLVLALLPCGRVGSRLCRRRLDVGCCGGCGC